MATITLKETLGHWVRLFGYFFGVAVVGGAVAGGGLALLEDVPNWAPGGAAPDVGVKLVAGAGLLAVGALVLLTGFFTIVLVVVATAVRYGVEAAGDDVGGDRADDSTEKSVPDPAERLASRRRTERASATERARLRRPQERTESQSPAGPATEHPNKAERSDATDRDADWMREVERDLVEEETTAAGQTATSNESTAPSHGNDSTDRPPEEPAPTEERTENAQADDWERPASETTDATLDERDETGADWVGADELKSDDPTADVTDESDVPVGDRPSTASDGPADDAIDATDGSADSGSASDPAGGERETTGSADDPLAPDDFEPEPVENDPEDATGVEEATEATGVRTNSDDDSTDSDDEPQ